MKGKTAPAQCNSHNRWMQNKTSLSFNLLPTNHPTTSFNLLLTIIIAILNLSNKKLLLWRVFHSSHSPRVFGIAVNIVIVI